MINKKVKEYSNRQRIDLNKNDGFNPGDEVIIITAKRNDEIKETILDLRSQLISAENKLAAKDEEITIYKNQEQNLKQIIKDVTAPIYENHKKELSKKDDHYQKELSKKDDEINQLQIQLDLLKDKINRYNLDMQGLNAIDIAIFRKHKKLIKNFNDEITIIGADSKIIDADAKTIPGADGNAAKDQEQ